LFITIKRTTEWTCNSYSKSKICFFEERVFASCCNRTRSRMSDGMCWIEGVGICKKISDCMRDTLNANISLHLKLKRDLNYDSRIAISKLLLLLAEAVIMKGKKIDYQRNIIASSHSHCVRLCKYISNKLTALIKKTR